jgi:hypothetical protein
MSPAGTTLTFVNSHLAAFDEQFDKRNADFQDISKTLRFDSDLLDVTGLVPLPITVFQCDVLFWMVRPLAVGFMSILTGLMLLRAVRNPVHCRGWRKLIYGMQ